MSTVALPTPRLRRLLGELPKLMAFFRRDLHVMWSYRLAFFMGWGALLTQVLMFSFVGKMVDPSVLPSFGGVQASYLEFVAVGMAVTSFVGISLSRIATALRNEQLMGTLESLLMTPTSAFTLQVGSVVYDLMFVPLQTSMFLLLAVLFFDINFAAAGILPAAVVLLAFIPVIWGIGMVSAAAVLTFRRGAGIINLGAAALFISSGSFFPVELFPGWVAELSRDWNPVTITLYGMRDALLGGEGWSVVWSAVPSLVPMAAVSLTLGVTAFNLALRRERRKGTLGSY